MSNKTKLSLAAIGLLVVSLGAFWCFNRNSLQSITAKPVAPATSLEQTNLNTPVNKETEPVREVALAKTKGKVPLSENAEFTISGGSPTSTIRFYEGSINPLDVHVGNTQDFRIVVSSDNGIKRVVAEIETDFGYDYVELKKDRVISVLDTIPNRYAVNPKDNTLKILNDTELAQARSDEYQKELAQKKSNQANASLGQREVWIGSWLVNKVHDKVYHTNFIAYDSAGNQEKITMAWSDLCAIKLSGPWDINIDNEGHNCSIPTNTVDGVANGTTTINNGLSLTLAAGSTFLWSNGQSVKFETGGELVVNTGGQMKQVDTIYVEDKDNDHYLAPEALGTTQTSTYRTGLQPRANTIVSPYSQMDCLDTNAGVFPGRDTFSNVAISGLGAPANWDWDCSSLVDGNYLYRIERSLKPSGKVWTSDGLNYFCTAASIISKESLSSCNPDGCEENNVPAVYIDPDQQQTRIKESIFSKKYLKLPLSFKFINEAKAASCSEYCVSCKIAVTGCGANGVFEVAQRTTNDVSGCGLTNIYPAAYFDNAIRSDSKCGGNIGIDYLTNHSATIYCK